MSAIVPRDPLPGQPLVYRIDTRNGRDCIFWCKVRLAFLPRLRGHAFWVSDEAETEAWVRNLMDANYNFVVLPRPLLLQYAPEYVRLSPAEREHIRQWCFEGKRDYVRNSDVTRQLKTAGLVRGRKVSTKGWNSYYLSP